MTAVAPGALATPRVVRVPSFVGLVRAEIFRTVRQFSTWLMLGIVAGVVALPWVTLPLIPRTHARLLAPDASFITQDMEATLALLRVFGGFFIAILMARIIGLDYQNGTIRIILARGVGRLQLLGAKLTAGALLTAGMVAAGLVWIGLVSTIFSGVAAGTFAPLTNLTGTYWSTIGQYALTDCVSAVATLLMAASMTVIGRSLSFGMTAAIGFFPADNFGAVILLIVANVTGNDFWLKLPAYFLGPNLNLLPAVWLPTTVRMVVTPQGVVQQVRTAVTLGFTPAVNYDLTHSLVVIALYCVAFAGVACFLTWRRDVQE